MSIPAQLYFFIRQYTIHRHNINKKLEYDLQPFRTINMFQITRFEYPYNLLEEQFDMAGKKSGRKNFNTQNMEFINFRFSTKEKEAFNEWLAKGDSVTLKAVKTTVQDDNKLGISWDAENGVYVGTLMGKEGSVNEGKCIIIRSKEWERSLFACAYTHEVIFKGGVWEVDDDGDLA